MLLALTSFFPQLNCEPVAGHEKSALELLLPLSTLTFDHVLFTPFDASRPSRLGYPDASAVIDMYRVCRPVMLIVVVAPVGTPLGISF